MEGLLVLEVIHMRTASEIQAELMLKEARVRHWELFRTVPEIEVVQNGL